MIVTCYVVWIDWWWIVWFHVLQFGGGSTIIRGRKVGSSHYWCKQVTSPGEGSTGVLPGADAVCLRQIFSFCNMCTSLHKVSSKIGSHVVQELYFLGVCSDFVINFTPFPNFWRTFDCCTIGFSGKVGFLNETTLYFGLHGASDNFPFTFSCSTITLQSLTVSSQCPQKVFGR